MMWLFLLVYIAHTELILHVQGGAQLILKGGKGPCDGHAEIYYEKKWGYVGDKYWDDATEEVVCRSTHCGGPMKSKENNDVPRPMGSTVWLNEVKCNGSENNLLDCKYPGLNISTYRKDTVKRIDCSREISISLDGFRCAGAVQYSIKGEHSGYFCPEKWGKEDADFLCKHLNCDESRDTNVHEWMIWKRFKDSEKMMINCPDINSTDHLWQCVTQKSATCQNPVSVECKDHDRVQLRGSTSNVCSGRLEKLNASGKKWNAVKKKNSSPADWCKQMYCGTNSSYSLDDSGIQLTCTDSISVELRDLGKSSKCYGVPHINVNGQHHRVCGSAWDETAAEVVCKELNCGKVVSFSQQQQSENGIMDNVKCLGSEASLWHCRAKRDINTLSCSSLAYVVCAGSVDVRLKDGPGRCAGRVEIQHKGQWNQVPDDVQTKWSNDNTNSVCRQINCGMGRDSSEKFSKGSNNFLTNVVKCESGASNISECFTAEQYPSSRDEAKGITCTEHKVVFLNDSGGNPCSGMVGIEHGENIYWLSGSTETWNEESANIVCQKMHCGIASNFSSPKSKADTNVWDKALNHKCLANATSLFECEIEPKSSDHNGTIATVDCSGNITVSLTSKCWGSVSICMDRTCGLVTADAWTETDSAMLCKSLGCGDGVLRAINQPQMSTVMIKSLHKTKQTTNLNQCNFVMADENDKLHKPAYVVCSGSVKSKLSTSRDKCLGNVEVLYDNKWLPVCMDALQEEAQHTICEELGCGKALNKVPYFGPTPGDGLAISKINCSKTGTKSLKECHVTYERTSCNLAGLQCTNWKKMKVSDTCKGAVSVYSKDSRSAVSIKGWTKAEEQRLCQDLNCGGSKPNKINSTELSFRDRRFNCIHENNPESIWDCEVKTAPSRGQQDQQDKQLFIECQDEPNVTLSKKCRGVVKINKMEVCDNHWDINYSHLICQEQNCSNAIVNMDLSGLEDAKPNQKYQHVSCDDYHYKLGQCKRVEGPCTGKQVSVFCVGNVKFNTTEKCGGQIQVDYGKGWEKVCPLNSSGDIQSLKTKLCQELGCNSHNEKIPIIAKQRTVKLNTALECTAEHNDIKHCVVIKSCGNANPAEIYCEGYVPPKPIIPPQPGPPAAPIVLGVGLLLVLLILVIIFVRICIVKKRKNAVKKSRMMSMNEAEFESGDYEDVMSKSNEMEDFSHEGFRSEAEVITENDARSASSFPYDDIDEALEAQPLTSHAATAGSSRDNYTQEAALNQSDGKFLNGVTYEVEDPQENYDDIEASPDLTQTKAEVHDSPKTTPESDTVAPPGLVQEDVDYLVPGEDG